MRAQIISVVGCLLCPALAIAGPDDPRVPDGMDPGGVAVAHIDTGVNYTLPIIAKRLARDGEGDVIGYDLQDDDLTPFDAQPGSKGTTPRRHGTSVANVLLREAPGTRLQPYRYAARSPGSFAEIVHQIAYTSARIVAMPLGGYTPIRLGAISRSSAIGTARVVRCVRRQ